MATALSVAEEDRILLEDVSWEAYEALLDSWADRRIWLTYDNGSLEIMSPLLGHEGYSGVIGQLIEAYTEEMRIPRRSGYSTTFRKKQKMRGLEPDRCYWIQNEPHMRGRKEFDFDVDPPPDLAIEVDVTASSLDRMSIYASLGVPEVWRFDGETLTVNLLQSTGEYAESDRSRALPGLQPEEVMAWLRRSDEEEETTLIRKFRARIRKQARAKAAAQKRRRSRGT